MKKIGIIFIILSLIFLSIFVYLTIKNKDNIKQNEKIENIENLEKQEENFITKEKVNSKIENLRKKARLKWLITKADMYFENDDYINALLEYQKILKEVPNDEKTNLKVWDIYYKIHKYKKANEYYNKVIDSKNLDNDKAIFSLINERWVSIENIEKIKNDIDKFKISKEKNFYYKNSLDCVIDYSLCRDWFQKYFEKNKNLETEEMKNIANALENFKNFKSNDLYYKAAFMTWAFYENAFYYISMKTSENILKQKNNYKPIMKIAAKSAYEIWNYSVAKKYLTEIKKEDLNDPEISYFLARVYEKLNDRSIALVNYKKALNDWYVDPLDIKRRLVFLYFESWDYRRMLFYFDDIIKNHKKELNVNDYNLAIYYNIINDKLEKAKRYAIEASRKFNDKDIFYWYISWIMLQKDNLTTSELEYIKENIDKALSITSKNPMTLMVKWIYNFKIWNHSESIRSLKLAYNLDKTWEFKDIINNWLDKVSEDKNMNNN